MKIAFLMLAALVTFPALADHTSNPTNVTIAGNLQDEIGCPSDWQPDCSVTYLSYDAEDDVWQNVFAVPAGNWEYKAALNNSWDENYGQNAEQNGSNIPLDVSSPGEVKFYYDHKTHWVIDDINARIATAVGSFQTELGCTGNWQPWCLRSWLQDPDGDSIYTFSTESIPEGNYEAKVAIGESWDENYGANGIQDGPNVQFSVPAGAVVTFQFDSSTNVLDIYIGYTIVDVIIDVKPGKVPNSINVNSGQKVPVVVLTTGDFDAVQVDVTTVAFGPGGATEVHGKSHVVDIDLDGDMDVLFHFDVQETGLECGDAEVNLIGETFGGIPIEGTDSVRIIGCEG
jgi:hypothetical protein